MVKKTLHDELRELESKKQEIEKELEKKRKLKEEQDKIKQEKWEKKIKKILDSCEGNLVYEWYDTDNFGYEIYQGILNNGYFTSYDLTMLEEAIEHVEKCKQEEIETFDNHKTKLQNFMNKLKELNQTGGSQ